MLAGECEPRYRGISSAALVVMVVELDIVRNVRFVEVCGMEWMGFVS